MKNLPFEKYQKIPQTFKEISNSMMKIAIPVSLQMVLIAGLQLIDNFFIGHLKNAEQVAAGVNAINNITFIISALVSGFIGGIGVYMIRSSVFKDHKIKHEIFRIKLIWMIILSSILVIPTLIMIRPIASLWVPLNSNQALNFANEYGQLVLLALVLGFLVIVFGDTLKEGQIIRITVYISLVAVAINSILNYLLMYVLDMGIRGAAIATIIARVVEIIIWISYFQIMKPNLIPKIRSWFHVPIKKLFIVFPKCFLWMLNQFLLSLSFTIQILILSRISIAAGASLNSAGAILQLFRAFIVGYAQAITIMVVYFIGISKKLDPSQSQDFLKYFRKLAILSFSFGLSIGIICSALAPLIFLIYPNYSYNTNLNSLIMIIAASLSMSISLLCDVPIATLKGIGISKKLIGLDALFGWIVTLPVVISITYSGNELIMYGWIYCIASATIILKPFPLFKVATKALKANKELNMKGLYEN